jgi:predicted RNase H-like HicB family nuclease
VKRKFTITIKQKGKTFFVSCKEMLDATAQADSKVAVLEKIRAVIIKRLEGGSDSGTSAKPHPHSPIPRGPIIVAEAHELPE